MSRTWAGVPVAVHRLPGATSFHEVFVDQVLIGSVWAADAWSPNQSGWSWALHHAPALQPHPVRKPAEQGTGATTKGRAVDALLAAYTKHVDEWATP